MEGQGVALPFPAVPAKNGNESFSKSFAKQIISMYILRDCRTVGTGCFCKFGRRCGTFTLHFRCKVMVRKSTQFMCGCNG
jgi:hypothetical protein